MAKGMITLDMNNPNINIEGDTIHVTLSSSVPIPDSVLFRERLKRDLDMCIAKQSIQVELVKLAGPVATAPKETIELSIPRYIAILNQAIKGLDLTIEEETLIDLLEKP